MHMAHTHTHTHGVSESSSASHMRRLSITLALTGTIFIAEVIGAVITGSLALLVDAGHMLTDVSVLAASTLTAYLMQRKPNKDRTWGWARLESITAAGGSLVLLFVGLYALVEAVMRLTGQQDDVIHDIRLLLFFGILGLAANIGSLFVLKSDAGDNLNMRAAFLEVCNDALGSVAVIISAIVMMTTGWDGVDALAGALIALLMIPRAIRLLRDAMRVLLEETPQGLDLDEVRDHLQHVDHVIAVHDLHASMVSTGQPILTAHIVVEPTLTMNDAGRVLHACQDCLREHFPVSIPHTTFQIEPLGYTSDNAGKYHA